MATFTVENLTFTYPGKEKPALKDISFDINTGELVAICGRSGSGKSTLMRNLKPILAPHGQKEGRIYFYGQDVDSLSQKQQASRIGYVLQNPDSQIVTDKVWHELAFGLESLGMDTKTIRLRVAEMASFFGIQTWFHKDVNHLSGGQKQLLNLASIMAMQPDVLILDEPTSQLDPIAAGEFLDTVKKINRELGTTVIITEHRLEEVMPMADKAVVLERGELVAIGTPPDVGAILAQKNHPMFMAMPTPLQAYSIIYQDGIGKNLKCPLDVRDGRNWLTELFAGRTLLKRELPLVDESLPEGEPVIEMKDVWFKYDRHDNDVIKDLSLKVYPGELFCMVGGNGTGKSTTLSLAGGINKPYRGTIKIKGKNIDKYIKNDLFKGMLGILPQNPQSIFVERSVRLDLLEIFEGHTVPKEEQEKKVREVAELVEIVDLLDMHPYDLSGGEQQRAALAKILLLNPEILFLDEPTKGLDNSFKFKLAKILKTLLERGVTIIMVSHDVEFCGRYADRCAMFFDGKIITTNAPRKFFSGNSFYTTAANRMSRHIFDNAVNVDDIVELIRDNFAEVGSDGRSEPPGETGNDDKPSGETGDSGDDGDGERGNGCGEDIVGFDEGIVGHVVPEAVDLLATANSDAGDDENEKKRHIPKVMVDAAMLLAAASTILAGFYVFDNKQYFVVGALIALYSLVPFFIGFERRKPKAREIVIIAVMVAAAVVGRAAFFMVPNFKPILAIIIISGVALGKESGFLVGAMSAFVSNFLFGQGPWTPWQMLAMAIIGYLAGLIFHRYSAGINKYVLMIFGGAAVFFIYGGIVDIWTILVMTSVPTWQTVITVYGAAVYFNFIHGAATVIFLFLLAKPMIGKLNRAKIKYGMDIYN